MELHSSVSVLYVQDFNADMTKKWKAKAAKVKCIQFYYIFLKTLELGISTIFVSRLDLSPSNDSVKVFLCTWTSFLVFAKMSLIEIKMKRG